MSKTKTAGVIVSFNRKELLKQSIESLMNQTLALDAIYVIDNCSTDGTYDYMNELQMSHTIIKYVRLPENIGGSGGFYEGIKRSFDDGYDYIWGMDDDAFATPTAHEELCKIRNIIEQKLFCLWSNCNKDLEFDDIYKKVDSWMFVGFYLPRIVIENVGLPRNDFFIYHDDSEYAHRILKKGIPIIKVRDSIIEHTDGFSKQYYERRIFGRVIQYPVLPDWKHYYFIRNFILKYSYKESKKYYIIFALYPWFLLKLIILHPRQISNFLKAYFHGIIGKSGIIMRP